MSKVKINLDDPETRAVWDTVQRAKDEVASWPAWKRGEAPEPTYMKHDWMPSTTNNPRWSGWEECKRCTLMKCTWRGGVTYVLNDGEERDAAPPCVEREAG